MSARDWYEIFDATEFEASGLVSRSLSVQLTGRGEATFHITRGNLLGVTYLDTFLPVQLLGANPFAAGGYAVYRDPDDKVWFGFDVA